MLINATSVMVIRDTAGLKSNLMGSNIFNLNYLFLCNTVTVRRGPEKDCLVNVIGVNKMTSFDFAEANNKWKDVWQFYLQVTFSI